MSTQSQAFCLKLNSHQTHVIDQFQKLYSDELMCDCTLSCNDGSIKAHKLVLSACSPYLTTLFTQFSNPYQYPIIILKDISFGDLRVLIEFMYRGEVTVSQNILQSVLEAAKALQITGLREIKIANQESKQDASLTSNRSNKRRKRKHESLEGNDSTVDSDGSEVNLSENELNETSKTNEQNQQSLVENDDGTSYIHEQIANEQESIEIDQDNTLHQTISTKSLSTTTKSTRQSTALNLNSPQKLTSTNNSSLTLASSSTSTAAQSHKQNLRQLRIEKTQATTGNLSGRKMWTEEETKCLVKIWEEESARVWASAGKKMLSLQRISDLLNQENVDRDVSQVEGKIKALKRDYKQIKDDKAIASVQQRMAPYLDKLEKIFSREEI